MNYKLRTPETIDQHDGHAMEPWRASVSAGRPAWVSADDSGLVCHDCGTVYVDDVDDYARELINGNPWHCGFSEWDGNRDDPTYYHCGHARGHAGEHGAWKL